MKKLIISMFLLLILAACSPAADLQADVTAINCETYYRSSATSEGQAQSSTAIFELNPDEKEWSETFTDMTLLAAYHDDEFEGRGLQIVVSDAKSGRQMASYLYQFQSDKLPVNQFQGGHGFTGLAYVYHPESPSELQFFCKIQ
jgi:hypothetical protein